MSSLHVDVKPTIGALVAGSFMAVALSAVVGFQCFLYFQIFPADKFRYKFMVAWFWMLDAVHTVLICTVVWEFAITHFGNPDVSHIYPSTACSIILTSLTIVSSNIFYGWRLHKLSKGNWWITVPLAILSLARIFLSVVAAVEMFILKSFPELSLKFNPLVTTSLSVSVFTDIMVSVARYYYLRELKEGYLMSQEVLDGIVIFTVNDGCITCAVAVATIACWLIMPHNYIWLSIYFSMAKFYSNSVLSTLNLRNWYRHRPVNPMIPMKRSTISRASAVHALPNPNSNKRAPGTDTDLGIPAMEVFVDHQVEYVGDLVRDERDEDTHSQSSHKSMGIEA